MEIASTALKEVENWDDLDNLLKRLLKIDCWLYMKDGRIINSAEVEKHGFENLDEILEIEKIPPMMTLWTADDPGEWGPL